jgi:hypothetical protein
MYRLLAISFSLLMVLSSFAGCTSSDGPEGTITDVEELFEGDEAGECSDEADNDRDGLFDCDDPNCAGAGVCEEQGQGNNSNNNSEEEPIQFTTTGFQTGDIAHQIRMTTGNNTEISLYSDRVVEKYVVVVSIATWDPAAPVFLAELYATLSSALDSNGIGRIVIFVSIDDDDSHQNPTEWESSFEQYADSFEQYDIYEISVFGICCSDVILPDGTSEDFGGYEEYPHVLFLSREDSGGFVVIASGVPYHWDYDFGEAVAKIVSGEEDSWSRAKQSAEFPTQIESINSHCMLFVDLESTNQSSIEDLSVMAPITLQLFGSSMPSWCEANYTVTTDDVLNQLDLGLYGGVNDSNASHIEFMNRVWLDYSWFNESDEWEAVSFNYSNGISWVPLGDECSSSDMMGIIYNDCADLFNLVTIRFADDLSDNGEFRCWSDGSSGMVELCFRYTVIWIDGPGMSIPVLVISEYAFADQKLFLNIFGCMDNQATNYDPKATVTGSCEYDNQD